MRFVRLDIAVFLCLALAGLSSCKTQRHAFNMVRVAQENVITSYSHDGIEWEHHYLDDLSHLDDYDLAIAPNGMNRFLAAIHGAPFGEQSLRIYRGTAPDSWSEEYDEIPLPVLDDPNASYSWPQITHLRDGLYVILWLSPGRLHSAVFNVNNWSAFEETIFLTDVLESGSLDGVSIFDLSCVLHEDEVYVVWSPREHDRILRQRAFLGDDSFEFDVGAMFTPFDHAQITNVISHEERLWVGVYAPDSFQLLSSTPGTHWVVEETCVNPSLPYYGFHTPLLFVERRYNEFLDHRRFIRKTEHTGYASILHSFDQCEDAPFGALARMRRIEYHPPN